MERDDTQRRPDGGTPLPVAAGERTRLLLPWRRITGRLAGLIGESGVCALFGRAVRMLAPRHGWLSVGGERGSIARLLGALEHDLAGVDAKRAESANAELLETFTRLLSALIGDALTARLLAEAEQDSDGREGPPEAQEHT
ncbi:hypothetical protein [uncultured Massilia sp.]|uniref:hypothetical protein n=1 Tax=uncultured Massilia sp. TaxID=169973 RepID=UPI0025E5F69A|nr:hypothetical protein [uncultured Massilia sp.]